MHVQHGWNDVSRTGPDAAHVKPGCAWNKETPPAKQLRPPGHVGVLAIREKIRVEELAALRNIVDHLAPVQGRRGAGAENVRRPPELLAVQLAPPAIEVPHARGEVDPRRVDAGSLGRFKVAADRPQPSAHGSYSLVAARGFHQLPDEIGFEHNVGVQYEDPIARGSPDRLVLRGRESGVYVIEFNRDTAHE